MGEPRSDEAIRADRQSRREALDAYFARASGKPGSGLADYIQRLRNDHRAVIDGQGTYRGCVCGEVLCGKDLLLAWCDELIASYEAKVAEFAAETLRASDLAARAERAEADRDRLDAALTEIHQRAHLMFQRLGGETLRWMTERAWRALAYPDADAAAPTEETTS